MILSIINNEDLDSLYKLYKDNYIPKINEFTKIYSYSIENKNVAFIVFDVIYDRCEIIDLFVQKEYRNNKIASKLINQIEKNFSIKNITLEVKENNYTAINLYKKLGFKIVSIRKNYYFDSDGYLMLKEVG